MKSLLSWERGLKFSLLPFFFLSDCRSSRGSVDWNADATKWASLGKKVAPLVGAWIEISQSLLWLSCYLVAPLVGAWIEIKSEIYKVLYVSSLLSWERGLKYTHIIYIYLIHVAPLVGAWIEITKRCRNTNSHTPSLLSWERGLKSFGKSKC